MANLTIAQLTELLAAGVNNADLLAIWDDSASETKKITVSQFKTVIGAVTSVGGTSPIISSGGLTPEISIPQSNGSTNGYLSSSDWSTFNGKQNAITLTTTGSSGSSSFISNTLNIPTYTLSGLGGVPTSRTLTINGVAQDLSADRSWTIASVVNWSETFSSATQATSQWTPLNAATNVNAAITPKGTGALVAQIPTGTTVGGNARGTYSVDFQMQRANANQVASGNYSCIISGEQNRVAVNYSAILSGYNNTITSGPGVSAIITGDSNQVLGGSSLIGSGFANNIGAFNENFIGSGSSNTISAATSFIGSGLSNTISAQYGTIGGGRSNTVSGQYGVVSGGFSCQAINTYAAVLGGVSNIAGGSAGLAVGGQENISRGSYDIIVGGYRNETGYTGTGNESHRFIGGGESNVIGIYQNDHTTIVAGSGNTIYGFTPYAFIGAGRLNNVCGGRSVIVGGDTNRIGNGGASLANAATYCFLGGGQTNVVDTNSDYSSVVGGLSNQISGVDYAFIGGGANNQASGNYSFIGGGGDAVTASSRNVASAVYSVVVGGAANVCADAVSFIGGGADIQIAASSINYNSVVGGVTQRITAGVGGRNFIGGGEAQTINGAYRNSIIGGGASNSIGGSYSGIFSGQSNTNNATHSVIIGGIGNTINGYYHTVSGYYNTISGSYYTCNIFGENNTAAANGVTILGASSTGSADGVIVSGYQANGQLFEQKAHAAGRFSANGDAQSHELIWRRLITGTAQTELFLDGSSIAAILPSTNCLWQGTIEIASICTVVGNGTTTLGDAQGTTYKVTIKRLGTNTTLVGTVQEIGTTNADPSALGTFTIDANNTNESLRIQFTPPASAGSTTVHRVVATFKGLQIQY